MAPKNKSLLQRVTGAYLGLAVGDALGASTEFLTPNEIKHQYGLHKEIIGGGWLNLKAGSITDDTEMSLALGQSILENQGVNAMAVAEAFNQWMKSKPVDIGNTVRRGLLHYRKTHTPRVAINEHDAGNGACMRCLPIAIFYHKSEKSIRKQAALNQAQITHNNPVADAGMLTIIEMLVNLFHNGDKKQTLTRLQKLQQLFPEYHYSDKPLNNPSGWIVETLKAVFQSFYQHDNFEDILIDIVNRGGDADTTGAIAGMLAGALYGIDDIPIRWLEQLNQTVYKACHDQAIKLAQIKTEQL